MSRLAAAALRVAGLLLTLAVLTELALPEFFVGGPSGFPVTSASAVTPAPASPGDANCDGLPNSIDASLVPQLDAGLIPSLPCADVADVDGDGTMTAADAMLIWQYEAGFICCLPPAPSEAMVRAAAGTTATLVVGSTTVPPGGQGSVDLEAFNVTAPGLGAWTIDITYDPLVLSAVSCTPYQGGVCNHAYDASIVRVSGASAMGVVGDNLLASVTFYCEGGGSSSVTPIVALLVDATIGDPQPVKATVQGGSFTCGGPPATPTPTPTPCPTTGCPTATPTPTPGEPTVRVGSLALGVGEQGSVDLDALDIASPGLGAWTIDITYDHTAVTAESCNPQRGVCNATYHVDTVRFTGAVVNGLEGDTTIGTVTFQCAEQQASTDLTLTLQVFADATLGDPQPIDASVESGSIICGELPTPTPTLPPIGGVGVFSDATGASASGGGTGGVVGMALAVSVGGAIALGGAAWCARMRRRQ